jgi:translation initiation factor 2 beta subunit (eIF-2beta)/eIF-5
MSPSHIDLIRNGQITNICESSYISDILERDQKLVIQLWKNDLETIESITKKNLGILIDTSGIQ